MPLTFPVSYSSVSLMMTVLPDLGSVTTLTSAHLANFAGAAQAQVNARIARHYSLPLASEIPELQRLTTDIAIYYTLTRRLFTQERLNSSLWPDRYKEALETLSEIADGTIPLIDASGTILGARVDVAEVWSTTKEYVPTFHEGGWPEQVQDLDKLEDEAARRD